MNRQSLLWVRWTVDHGLILACKRTLICVCCCCCCCFGVEMSGWVGSARDLCVFCVDVQVDYFPIFFPLISHSVFVHGRPRLKLYRILEQQIESTTALSKNRRQQKLKHNPLLPPLPFTHVFLFKLFFKQTNILLNC